MNTFRPMGCIQVRYPANPSHSHKLLFFLDFSTHEEANRCLEQSCGGSAAGGNVEVMDVVLTMKWSSGGRRMCASGPPPPPPPPGHVGIYGQQQHPSKRTKARMTEQEAADSSSLFVHLNALSMSTDLCSRGIQHVGNLAQKMLEDAINNDGDESTP